MCLISDPLCFERLLAPETIQDSVEVRHFYYKKVHLAADKIMNCDWNWYVSKKSFRYGKSAFLIKKKKTKQQHFTEIFQPDQIRVSVTRNRKSCSLAKIMITRMLTHRASLPGHMPPNPNIDSNSYLKIPGVKIVVSIPQTTTIY